MQTQDKTMAELVSEAVSTQMQPALIEPIIADAVEKLVTAAVKDSIRSYSDNGKLIEDAIKESLKVGSLDLPSYSTTVCTILKELIEKQTSALVAGQLQKDMENLLSLGPKEIRLSEIVKSMLENHYDYDTTMEEDLVTCIVDDANSDSFHIYLDPDAHYSDSDRYRCQISLFVREDGTIVSGDVSERGGSKKHGLYTSSTFGRSYGMAQKVRSWWACGTKIILDQEEVTTRRHYD